MVDLEVQRVVVEKIGHDHGEDVTLMWRIFRPCVPFDDRLAQFAKITEQRKGSGAYAYYFRFWTDYTPALRSEEV